MAPVGGRCVTGVSHTAWIRNVLCLIGPPPQCSELRKFERIQTPFRAFLCICCSKMFGAKSGAHPSGEAGLVVPTSRPFARHNPCLLHCSWDGIARVNVN
jgi:hypothetical protein